MVKSLCKMRPTRRDRWKKSTKNALCSFRTNSANCRSNRRISIMQRKLDCASTSNHYKWVESEPTGFPRFTRRCVFQSKIRELEKKMELENVKQEELQLELEHHKKSNLRTSYKSTDLALNSPAESTTSSADLSKWIMPAVYDLCTLTIRYVYPSFRVTFLKTTFNLDRTGDYY